MDTVFFQQIWNGCVSGTSYTLFAVGLNLIFGMLGVINFAQGQLYMLGAIVLWTLVTILHLNFFLSFIFSIILLGLFGVFFNRIAIKPLIGTDPLIIMLATMAMNIILVYGSSAVWGPEARSISFPVKGAIYIGSIVINHAEIVLVFLGMIALVGLHLFLKKTIIGKAMQATAQDREGSYLVGINVPWIYGVTMAIASLLAAVAGGVAGTIWVTSPAMGKNLLLKGFAILVVIGLGNRRIGPILIIGLGLGIMEALFSQYVSTYYRDAYTFGLLVLGCLFRA